MLDIGHIPLKSVKNYLSMKGYRAYPYTSFQLTVISAWIAGIQGLEKASELHPCILDSAIPWRNDGMCVRRGVEGYAAIVDISDRGLAMALNLSKLPIVIRKFPVLIDG